MKMIKWHLEMMWKSEKESGNEREVGSIAILAMMKHINMK